MKRVSWSRALGGAVVAEVGQIAATFGWVAIYSHFIDPGHHGSYYETYAQKAGPWVSILAGAPIFYLAARVIARSQASAVAMFGIFFVVDGGFLVASGGLSGALLWQVPVSYATKLVACWLGGRHGAGTAARR